MKLPNEIKTALDDATQGLDFGTVTLEIKVHDGRPKYRIIKEISIIVPVVPDSNSVA